MNVNGDAVFGPPGNDLFTTLAQISGAIHGNQPLDRAQRPAEDADPAGPDGAGDRSDAIYARVDNIKSQNTTDATTMKQNLSNIEDADMAQVMMNLQAQETTYQAALAATAKAIQPSLADFLQ